MPKYVQITSFDIGYRNLGYYTEKVNLTELIKLRNSYVSLKLADKKRRCAEFVNALCENGTMIDMAVEELTIEKEYNMDARKNLVVLLDENRGWKNSHIIVIEQQFYSKFSKKIQVNMDAIKIAEDILMYFSIKHPEKHVFIFNSSFKTRILGAPSGLSKSQRKNWSDKKAQEIFKKRGDAQSYYIYELHENVKRKRKLEAYITEYEVKFSNNKIALSLCEKIVKEKQKLNDISDAVTQLQAFKFKELLCN